MDAMRHASIVTIVVAIILWLWWAVKYRQRWLLSVAPLSWLIHSLVFALVREMGIPLSVSGLNIWSTAIRLHGVILLIVIVVLSIGWLRDD